jgi:hypothetical protein
MLLHGMPKNLRVSAATLGNFVLFLPTIHVDFIITDICMIPNKIFQVLLMKSEEYSVLMT